ncbi:MAG: transporter substrate-binding domain-containing protein [Pseudomonadota bacterium]
MTKFATSALAGLLCLLTVFGALAQSDVEATDGEALRDVRVVFTRLPPYVMEREGTAEGYSIDLLRAVAEREGWRLSFVEAPNPAEALEMLRTGEADLHPNLAQTPERNSIVDFSFELGSWDVSAIVDPTRTSVQRVNQTAGMKFGYVRGSIARTAVGDGPFTTVEMESIDQLLVNYLSGELDGVLFVAEAFTGIAFSTGNDHRVEVLPPTLRRFGRHIVISKASGLKPQLDAALFAFLETEEHAEMRRKWFGDDRFWTTARIGEASMALLLFFIAIFWLYRRRIAALKTELEAERLRLMSELTDALPFGVHIVDEDDRLRFANKALRELEINWDEAIDNREDHYDFTKRILSDGRFDTGDLSFDEFCAKLCDFGRGNPEPMEFRTRDGGFIRRRIISLSDGSRVFLREDVTEDRRIRHDLQEQQARLNAVLDAAQSGVVGLASDGRIGIANPMARAMLGDPGVEEAFKWKSAGALLDPKDMKPLTPDVDPVARALEGETITNEIAVIEEPNGAPRFVSISSAPLPDDAPGDLATVLVLDDVTERERNRQTVERTSRLDALGQLTGGIAHDFNNLLAVIEYSIQLADKSDDADKRAAYNENAIAAVRRGSALTTRLLAFARRQPGISRAKPVGEVMEDLRALLEPAVRDGLALDLEIENEVEKGEPLLVYCDIAQLENAILNLVLNARDAIKSAGTGSRVVIAARALEETPGDAQWNPGDLSSRREPVEKGQDNRALRYVEITVTDDGPGMSEEVLARATDPFFTTKDANMGAGLGLSMVYGFIKQARGDLRIYSEQGRGVTVRLVLPRGVVEGGREAPVKKTPLPKGDGEIIMLVDDEPDLLKMLQDVIASLGYRVIPATGGATARQIIESEVEIDLMLTDVLMPGGLSGFDLAALARETRPELKVLYMSGYAGFTPLEMGRVIAPLIQKPCPSDELAEALNAAFGRSADAGPD